MGFSVSGLVSGINTDSMISQLMQLERIPYKNLETKKKDLGDSQTFFRTLNTKMNTLKTVASDLTLGSNFNLSSVKSSDETAAKVSGTSTASTGNYNVVINNLAKSHVVKSFGFTNDGKGQQLAVGSKVTVDGQEIELKGSSNFEILENLKNDINKNSKNVSASVVETKTGEKTLVLTSTRTGTDHAINSTNGPKLSGFKAAGLWNDLSDPSHQVQAAENAKISVNGLDIESASNEIKGVIEGVTITALKEGSSSMVTVAKDADKVVEQVKKFIDAFNEVRKMIRDNTGKEKPLQGDSTLRSLDMELTDWVTGLVGPDGNTSLLAEFGIEMDKGKKGSEMDGQLVLDEKVFKEKLEQYPDKLTALFNYDGSKGGNKGIAQTISDKVQIWTSSANGILNSRIKGYDSEISFVTTAMENMEVRLQNKEKLLKKQFTAMELAMGQLQGQSNWLNTQLASLNASNK
ncbi:flagellar filament capping protein FliD [Paenibacillus sp. 1001270B_150601_E10]|uniref:flagellar filament capping protein FliD n=1 Tax=Paenibacillus sp. 1001270B_150601_E10 TaxID=2787079 RepID=UPI00189D39C8|nr:flagellar filament capping protein FliD [Paenibacillus sp. 1001270B_150601_E10]